MPTARDVSSWAVTCHEAARAVLAPSALCPVGSTEGDLKAPEGTQNGLKLLCWPMPFRATANGRVLGSSPTREVRATLPDECEVAIGITDADLTSEGHVARAHRCDGSVGRKAAPTRA